LKAIGFYSSKMFLEVCCRDESQDEYIAGKNIAGN
jgi:hypothetical protein